jgi:hypothetical protein
MSIDGVLFLCLAGGVLHTLEPELHGFALIGLDVPFALPCLARFYTWRGWWRGYPAFHVASIITTACPAGSPTCCSGVGDLASPR